MNCRQCGAGMADDAKFCPACGTSIGPTPPAAAKAMSKKAVSSGCAVVVIVGIIALVAMSGGNKDGSSSQQTASSQAAIAVTAEQLFDAYQANEAAAQSKYGARPLLVSGKVAGVDLDLFDKPFAKLRTSNEYLPAQAAFAEDAAAEAKSLVKGQSIRLRCETISEVVGTPMLKDCRIG